MDNPTKTGATDLNWINMHVAYDVNYWTEKLDITKVKLKAAVNAVGNSAKEVEAYLRKK